MGSPSDRLDSRLPLSSRQAQQYDGWTGRSPSAGPAHPAPTLPFRSVHGSGRKTTGILMMQAHWKGELSPFEGGAKAVGRGSYPRRGRPRCGARCRSKGGAPCLAPVVVRLDGSLSTRCRMHGGLSTGPRTPEGRRRVGEAARARWRRWREVQPATGAATPDEGAVPSAHGGASTIAVRVGERPSTSETPCRAHARA